ncbi:MAG: 16S rRNA (guanine(966)-N(2))-methyltransferase RsmD [Bacteroidetes bacterium]|nr:16S rRNA (guanine(966)-N(2))-methyltransferase RsmD [Bacteroidota bacterium]
MRITGGVYRGRRITCPPGIIRPAMDKMRESLFSILGNLDDLSFLDLFSGSGLVGIEAASRGADPVHLVEMDYGKRDTILQNISFVESDIQLFLQRAQKYIKSSKKSYDIVYADPPFPMAGKQPFTEAVSKSGIVKADGIFIIHYPSEEKWEEQIGLFTCYDKRTYGRSILRFFRYTEDPA